MTIKNGRCTRCRGEVRNGEGKRKTIEQLTAIHDPTCPSKGTVKEEEDGRTDLDDHEDQDAADVA